jgi:hypothetical protein
MGASAQHLPDTPSCGVAIVLLLQVTNNFPGISAENQLVMALPLYQGVGFLR